MTNAQKPQPIDNKIVEPVEPSKNPGTPVQKGPVPIEPVNPSQSPGTGIPFNERKSGKTIKGNN